MIGELASALENPADEIGSRISKILNEAAQGRVSAQKPVLLKSSDVNFDTPCP